MNFSPPLFPSPSFCVSRAEVKRSLESKVIVAKGRASNEVWSSASVARKAARTLGSSRRDALTSGVTSWRKMRSGVFGPSRIWLRMSLVRETGCEEKASMFHDMRESLCGTWLGTFCRGMGTQRWVGRLKAEREPGHQILLATMEGVVYWEAGNGTSRAFKYQNKCRDRRLWF